MSSRTFTGRLVDQMIWANIFPLFQVMIETKKCIYRFYFQISNSKRKLHSIDLFLHRMNTKSFSLIHLILVLYVIDSKSSYIQYPLLPWIIFASHLVLNRYLVQVSFKKSPLFIFYIHYTQGKYSAEIRRLNMMITKDESTTKKTTLPASVLTLRYQRNDDDETDLHQEVLCQVSIWAIQADTLLWIFNNVHIPQVSECSGRTLGI